MTALVVILTIVALAWVLSAARSGGGLIEPVTGRDDLEERRIAALSALADLDEELAAGKITVDDHATLRARYETDAVAVLHEIDASGR
ncbi:MAG TPA: hypothetical protein VG408_04865 [Actinomycetota bacterium]|nr:hypothetical protein [Actinomycetota bacterium]